MSKKTATSIRFWGTFEQNSNVRFYVAKTALALLEVESVVADTSKFTESLAASYKMRQKGLGGTLVFEGKRLVAIEWDEPLTPTIGC